MKYGDRIQVTTTGTGTSNLTLGSAMDTFRSFSNLVGSGLIPVTIVHADGSTGEFETGLCRFSGGELIRDKVIVSSNSNNHVNFSAGTKYVFVDYIAEANFGGTQLLKEAVVKVVTTNIVLGLTYAGVVYDGYTLVAGDRLLLAGQSDTNENGIYVVQPATSALVRANDCFTGETIGNIIVPVRNINDTFTSTCYYCNRPTAVVGTDNITFQPFITFNGTSPVDNAIPRFDGTSGHRLQSSGLTISDQDKLRGKSSYTPMSTQSGSGTITLNLNTDNKHIVTLTGTTTLALSNVSVGQVFLVKIIQDSTGGRALTWFSGINWPGATAPTITTTANKADLFVFICTDTGEYGSGEFDGVVIGQNYSV
jgi:hypothetical protein